MIKNVFLFSFVLLSIIPVQLFSQTKNCLPGGKDSVSSSFQVIYNKPNNGLPDSIHVKGKILSCCNGLCGFLCTGGSMEVELTEKIKNYPYKTIFLVTACMDNSDCGRMIDVVSSKLLETDSECYYKSVLNCYDENKIPFYKLSEKETNKAK